MTDTTSPDIAEASSGRSARRGLIAATVVLAALLLLSIVPAIMSVTMFDAPGSEDQVSIWIAFVAAGSLPFSLVIAIAGAWVAYARGHYRAAFALCLLPVLNAVLFVIGLSLW